jgi:tetratricopeptide (TPR) repeat protein
LELANLLCKTGDRDNAISYYQLSLNIRSSLEESDPSAEAKRQVLEVHRKLAELHIASGDVLATEACYMQSVPLAHTLCQETGDQDDMESLAMDYSNLAYARKQQGDPEQATALYRKCLQIRYAVAEESHAAHAWDMVGRTLLKIVLVDQENADNYLQQAAQIYHALTQAYPYDPQYQQFMTMLEEYL